jgi:hypothetical protein
MSKSLIQTLRECEAIMLDGGGTAAKPLSFLQRAGIHSALAQAVDLIDAYENVRAIARSVAVLAECQEYFATADHIDNLNSRFEEAVRATGRSDDMEA